MLKISIADNFLSRLFGLIGKKSLPPYHGLLLSPCNSIHMLFMQFPIDAIFIDKNFIIKKISKNLKPWIGFSFCFNAHSVVEINSGEVDILNLHVGDKLEFEIIKGSD